MYKFAIIGHPLSHSLSKPMQEAALKSCGFEGVYDVLDTEPENLISVIKKLKTENYQGFNVTIPHKVPITLFLEEFDDYANLAGAVNTVKIMDDKMLYGYNTDVWGFANSIPQDLNLMKENVAILGTGGASRAVCIALAEKKVSKITFYSRNIANSIQTIRSLREKFPFMEIELLQIEFLHSLAEYKMVVNTTPLGMKSFAPYTSPLTDEAVKTLKDDAYIYDLVYNPSKTALLKQVQARGVKYTGGADMLVLQGARAFEIWTGQKPDINLMKIALLENLE